MSYNHSESGDHLIEEHVKVYLTFDDQEDRWVLDPIIDPRHGPLEGLLDPAERGAECDCPRTATLPGPGYDEEPADERTAREQHEAILNRAARVALPDAEELLTMLAEFLGYGLVLPADQLRGRESSR
ncbi:MAG: hypothetical protein U0S13_08400 [Mycobacterium sp.]